VLYNSIKAIELAQTFLQYNEGHFIVQYYQCCSILKYFQGYWTVITIKAISLSNTIKAFGLYSTKKGSFIVQYYEGYFDRTVLCRLFILQTYQGCCNFTILSRILYFYNTINATVFTISAIKANVLHNTIKIFVLNYSLLLGVLFRVGTGRNWLILGEDGLRLRQLLRGGDGGGRGWGEWGGGAEEGCYTDHN
jgi:hypothetical protein